MYERTYIVKLNMTKVQERLKSFKIDEYSGKYPEVEVQAKNPDGACFEVYSSLFKKILDKDTTTKTKILCKECKADIFIMKISGI